ncbi:MULTISPECIES: acyl-CoA thioesterase [Mycolicibacterium]|uniref:Acyl-CoA thioesterase n=1 Tax=Mycolicibacterium gilvum (strain DSM 45189 / LMG 24558 / Spyr1) TaxID=278137 RepID=E6TG44_MYCSR|nr:MULTISPECIES: acyl-CoA thioesterase domain-containing protein [Mycolicibacterium]ADT98897.1 acyl-CoA thioesterase [Mycolicibacterium gilvum Spyr1]MBV5244350.1 thioesterase family protein [Mycolicibacterium sp. PAM1]
MAADLSGPLAGSPLETSVLESLDMLERALSLQPTGHHRFRAGNERDRFGRLFGGQLLAQAVYAAARTVESHPPHSVHAYFVQTGASDTPVDIAVDVVRDGRSMATRQVTIAQGERTLLTAMASFHTNPDEPELARPHSEVPAPEDVPLLQHWVPRAGAEFGAHAQNWIDVPPALEMRIAEPTGFLGGDQTPDPRSHWMRLPRPIADDPALHTAMLAYASDYLLLDMALRNHPHRVDYSSIAAVSLDHSLWVHRPVRFDDWHLYTQETVALAGHRALIRGTIRDLGGHTVASTSQEVLIRPTGARTSPMS